MRSPAWMAIPDDDDDEAVIVQKHVSSMSGTLWWLLTSMAILVLLMYAEAPLWLIAIVAAEAYASGRRWVVKQYSEKPATGEDAPATERQRRLRHFTSLKLKPGAPLDEIVARFTSLDSMRTVRSVELGTNSSTEQRSRGHTLGLMATFAGEAQRRAFLKSAERIAFNAFLEPYAEDSFVFDFESGAV